MTLDDFSSRYTVDDETGCWNWKTKLLSGGCGYMTVAGKQRKAYLVAWMLIHGPVPKGKYILRTCGNKLCVNPDHMKAGK